MNMIVMIKVIAIMLIDDDDCNDHGDCNDGGDYNDAYINIDVNIDIRTSKNLHLPYLDVDKIKFLFIIFFIAIITYKLIEICDKRK